METKDYQKKLLEVIKRSGLEYKKDELLTDDVIKEFMICFTHSSFNPIPDQNYDNKEFVGDKIYNSVICILFYSIYGNRFNQGIYTFMYKTFGSRYRMQELSTKMGFDSLIRYESDPEKKGPKNVTIKMKTDVFEAVIYFIFDLANRKIQKGLGDTAVQNFVLSLFLEMKEWNLFNLTDEDIDKLKDNTTILKELRDAIARNVKHVIDKITDVDVKTVTIPISSASSEDETSHKWKSTVMIKLFGEKEFKEYGTAVDFNKKIAANKAAGIALDKLKKEKRYITSVTLTL